MSVENIDPSPGSSPSRPELPARKWLAKPRTATFWHFITVSIGRRISGAGECRAKSYVTSTGTVNLSLIRTTASGAETTIQSGITIPGLNYAVGDRLAIRMQVTGIGITTVRAKVWKVGTAEPAGWQRSVADTTPARQGAGGVGLFTYLSSGATSAPVTALLDNARAAAP